MVQREHWTIENIRNSCENKLFNLLNIVKHYPDYLQFDRFGCLRLEERRSLRIRWLVGDWVNLVHGTIKKNRKPNSRKQSKWPGNWSIYKLESATQTTTRVKLRSSSLDSTTHNLIQPNSSSISFCQSTDRVRNSRSSELQVRTPSRTSSHEATDCSLRSLCPALDPLSSSSAVGSPSLSFDSGRHTFGPSRTSSCQRRRSSTWWWKESETRGYTHEIDMETKGYSRPDQNHSRTQLRDAVKKVMIERSTLTSQERSCRVRS